jgi:uncharacterized protein YjdB
VSDSFGGGPYRDMSEGYGMVSGDAYVVVQVRAGVSVAASSKSVAAGKSITLSAQVAPVDTAGRSVVFEWATMSGNTWHSIATKKLVAGSNASKASASWKVMSGKHRIRARFLGGPTNAANSSSAITVTG